MSPIIALFSVLLVASTDPDQRIQQAFRLTSDACAADDGRLWGESLCGPMLVADFQNHTLIADRSDPDGKLSPDGMLFRGGLPDNHPRANTAVEWGGRRWTQVLAPLPGDDAELERLFLHESFHRIQPAIGIQTRETNPAHLDEADGRIWQRMEWRALAVALRSVGADRLDAARDAARFRFHRHQLHPGAAEAEAELERNEGMAEYTGIRIAFGKAAAERAARGLDTADGWSSLPRQFAYASGPAWGLLLDDGLPGWRERVLNGDDLNPLILAWLGEVDPAMAVTCGRDHGLEDVEGEERRLAAERKVERQRLEGLLLSESALVLRCRCRSTTATWSVCRPTARSIAPSPSTICGVGSRSGAPA